MWAGLDEDEEDVDEFALDRDTTEAMPESTELTDEVLDTLERKCLCGSATGLRLESVELSLAGPRGTRKAGLTVPPSKDGISGDGTSSCLTSPLLTRRETRNRDTRKPSSVKSSSGSTGGSEAIM